MPGYTLDGIGVVLSSELEEIKDLLLAVEGTALFKELLELLDLVFGRERFIVSVEVFRFERQSVELERIMRENVNQIAQRRFLIAEAAHLGKMIHDEYLLIGQMRIKDPFKLNRVDQGCIVG